MVQLHGAGEHANAHFRDIVERSFSAIALLGPDGTILEANALALRSFGATREEVLGRALWDAPTWAAVPELKQRLRPPLSAAARGVTVSQETTLTNGAAATVLDLSFNPVASTDGTVVLLVAEWRDVSDRKRAEDALRESEERFQRIVSIAVDAIISIDEKQSITLFNQGAEQIFGYRAAEVIGKPLEILLPRELGTLHDREVRAFGASAETSRRMGQRRQIFGRRKNGEIFSAEASISKTTIGGQQVFTAVLRDVTERWAAEQEKAELLATAQEARQVAEVAARQRDEMLAIVSHDLRNPLNAIGLCSGLLADEETRVEDRQHLADAISESVELATRLIGDLMDLASIEAGRLSIQRRPLDPVITIGQAITLFEAAAEERALRLEAGGLDHLPTLEADGERLLQVLGNLISNALRFTDKGGTITVGATTSGSAVVFSVRDSGSGIAPEHLPRVFERRWHAEKSHSGGTGLGLFIARGIVEAHGGRISVESTPGQGALFRFTIPLTGEEGGGGSPRAP
jgi:PAS domain S-box-containing protein